MRLPICALVSPVDGSEIDETDLVDITPVSDNQKLKPSVTAMIPYGRSGIGADLQRGSGEFVLPHTVGLKPTENIGRERSAGPRRRLMARCARCPQSGRNLYHSSQSALDRCVPYTPPRSRPQSPVVDEKRRCLVHGCIWIC